MALPGGLGAAAPYDFTEPPLAPKFLSRSMQVFKGFGKLWKLIMQFSRTWKVLEKEKFFKLAMEKFWIFVWGKSKVAWNGYDLVLN